jgi:hypothetical protein
MKFLKLSFFLLSAFFLLSCSIINPFDHPGFSITPNPNLDPNLNLHWRTLSEQIAYEIQVYYILPPRGYWIIGELNGEAAPISNRTSIEIDMKAAAASIYADAIIVIDRREPYAGTDTTALKANAIVYGNYIYYTYQPGAAMHTKNLIGLVIKWKEKR